MSNEGPQEGSLAPRNRPLSVRATRPDIIDIPNAQTLNQPPTQSTPPQPYVVFINTPAATPPSAPIALQPPAQQIHNTHHHHYVSRRGAREGHSVLGMASLALGVIACVICWIPLAGLAAVPIGLIGATLGLLGFVLSAIFRKSSVALPAGGLFICLLAGGISIASTGSLLHFRQQLEKMIPRSIVPPSVIPPPPPASAAASPTAQPTDPKVFTATQQLSAANETATHEFMKTDAYRQAKQLRDLAHQNVDALSASSPNSDALKQAAQKMIDADNALSAELENALRANPAVIAAQQKLTALRHPASVP